jgi:precorrin-6B methylase 1
MLGPMLVSQSSGMPLSLQATLIPQVLRGAGSSLQLAARRLGINKDGASNYTALDSGANMTTASLRRLTKKQQAVFDFLARFCPECGFPPTQRGIGEAIGLPLERTTQQGSTACETGERDAVLHD